MKSVSKSDDRPPGDLQAQDSALLIRLSAIQASILRFERSAAQIRLQLREQQIEVTRYETTLRSDQRALAALKSDARPDRVALDVLEAALEGAAKAHRSATKRQEDSRDTTAPLLQHLVESMEALDREAADAREQLSSGALKCYEGLLRLRKLPFVAHVQAGVCGECHLKLPSALAAAVSERSALIRCPLCGRILLPPQSVPA